MSEPIRQMIHYDKRVGKYIDRADLLYEAQNKLKKYIAGVLPEANLALLI